MAKSAKTRAKKAAKKRPAKKAAAKKAAAKKVAAKRPVGKAAMMMAAAGAGTLGCCTITGVAGRNPVYPNVTKARCEELADQLGGNPRWYAGDCAQ